MSLRSTPGEGRGEGREQEGLRRALDVEIVQNLLDVAELRGEMRTSLHALNDKIGRLLALQEKVDRNSQAITHLKSIWSFVAPGIAPVVVWLEDWIIEHKGRRR